MTRPQVLAERALPVFVGLFAFFTPFSIAGAHTSLALACLLLLLVPEARRRAAALRTHPLALPVALWCLVSVVAAVFALDPARSLPKLKKLALLPLLPLGALSLVRGKIRPILIGLIASTAIVSAWGLIVFTLEGGGLAARLRGISGFYMTVAGILMMVALLVIAEILTALKDPSRRRVFFLGVSAALILAALAGTYTRGSWIGFLVGAVFLLRRHRTILIAVGTVCAAFVLGSSTAREQAFGILDPEHPRNQERVVIWKHGLDLLGDRPLIGLGLFLPAERMEREVEMPDGTVVRVHSHMHNAYLQIAVSMGLPALAVFGWLLFALFRMARRAERSVVWNLWEQGLVSAFPACLIALTVNGLFEWNFGDSEILGLFYCLGGLALGVESAAES